MSDQAETEDPQLIFDQMVEDREAGKTPDLEEVAPQEETQASADAPAEEVVLEEVPEEVVHEDEPETIEAEPTIAELQKEIEDGKQRERSHDGRIAAYQRQVTDLKNAAPVAAEVKEETEEDKPSEKYTEFEEEYGDIAEAVNERLGPIEKAAANANKAVSDLRAERVENALNNNHDALTEAHGDYGAIAATDEFQEWIGRQPAAVLGMMTENSERIVNLESANWLFDTFKTHTGYGKEEEIPAETDVVSEEATHISGKRERQLTASGGSKAGGRGNPKSGKHPTGSPEAQFNEFVRQKERKKRST